MPITLYDDAVLGHPRPRSKRATHQPNPHLNVMAGGAKLAGLGSAMGPPNAVSVPASDQALARVPKDS